MKRNDWKPAARLSWNPVRRGNIYCAPACGGNCTWEAYNNACIKVLALVKRLKGKGWMPRVHENMGWHYNATLRTAFGAIHVYGDTDGTFSALVSDHPDGVGGLAAWSSRFHSKDPNEVVQRALESVNAYIEPLVLCAESLMEAVETEHRSAPRRGPCEKCGKRTRKQVKVVDRWALWCGCTP